MQHLDEGTIHAWLDGELPLEERSAVEAHVASCDACKAAVAEARGFIAASSRILTALDAVPGGVVPATANGPATTRPAVHRRFVISRAWMAAAAVLVLSTVTVIAVRPGSDAAQLRVASASRDEKKQATSAAPAEDMPQPAAPSASNAPAPMQARKAAPAADESKPVVQNEVSKSRLETARQAAVPAPEPSAAAGGMAAQPATPPMAAALAKDAADKRADAVSRYDSLGERRASTTLDSAAADSSAPRMLSRNTIEAGGDTVVTTVYTVRGVSVSLIDHSRAGSDAGQLKVKGAASEAPARLRAAAAAVNSLTWSDSTGHTRTLRGALPLADLQRVKRALFGAMP
jgi:hypothetical protein